MQAQPRAVTVLPTQPSSLQLTQPDMQLQNFLSPENVSALRDDAICISKKTGDMALVLLNKIIGQSVPGLCSQNRMTRLYSPAVHTPSKCVGFARASYKGAMRSQAGQVSLSGDL